MFNWQVINFMYILFIIISLWALITDRFPKEYKKYGVLLIIAITLVYLYNLIFVGIMGREYMDGLSESIHSNGYYISIIDSYPGYDQPYLKIKKNNTVTWTNVGELEHTVTSDYHNFNSGYLKPGEKFSIKFDFTGEFPYHCIDHKGWMTGVIVVQ